MPRPDDSSDRLLYRIAFASLRGINYVLAGEFLKRLGSEKAFFEASERSLESLTGGMRSRLLTRECRDEALEAARREVDFVAAHSVRTLYYTDGEFPRRVRDTVDGPLMLYALGDCELNDSPVIAVVGTRHATSYGTGFTDKLIGALAQKMARKPVIVSGLAFGIDIAAHRAALREGLPTAAVLAHGLNTIYPSQHRTTAVEIARSGGMLMTDYRSCDAIHKGNFLARNRIVAGLCDCLVVVESAAKGGALITARIADDYSRDVFAVPGRLGDRYSAGCNRLIASSRARLLTDAEELVEEMGWPVRASEGEQLDLFPELSAEDMAVIDLLTERGEARAAELAVALGRPIGKVMATLVDLEFKGRVTSFPGGLFRPG